MATCKASGLPVVLTLGPISFASENNETENVLTSEYVYQAGRQQRDRVSSASSALATLESPEFPHCCTLGVTQGSSAEMGRAKESQALGSRNAPFGDWGWRQAVQICEVLSLAPGLESKESQFSVLLGQFSGWTHQVC